MFFGFQIIMVQSVQKCKEKKFPFEGRGGGLALVFPPLPLTLPLAQHCQPSLGYGKQQPAVYHLQLPEPHLCEGCRAGFKVKYQIY